MFLINKLVYLLLAHRERYYKQTSSFFFLQPFWPTGSGCARGFLSVFDTAWMMRSYRKPDKTPLQVIAERESVFQLLSQTKPDNLSRQLSNYTIDPRTRYLYLNLIFTTLPLYVDNNSNKIIELRLIKHLLCFADMEHILIMWL